MELALRIVKDSEQRSEMSNRELLEEILFASNKTLAVSQLVAVEFECQSQNINKEERKSLVISHKEKATEITKNKINKTHED